MSGAKLSLVLSRSCSAFIIFWLWLFLFWLRGILISDVQENLFARETHFWRVGIFVRRQTITERGDDGAGIALRLQAENFVVLRVVETFHRAAAFLANFSERFGVTGEKIINGLLSRISDVT